MKIWKHEESGIFTIFITFKKSIRRLRFNEDGDLLCNKEVLPACCLCTHFLYCDNKPNCEQFEMSDKLADGLINEYAEL